MTDTQTSEWIKHDGKGMPVDAHDLVFVSFPSGWTDEDLGHSEASFWVWEWDGEPSQTDIIAYRVVKP